MASFKVTTRQAKRVVEMVTWELQQGSKKHVGIETTEVFKGGSMGQGTRVPGHYDIDLVLYSRDLDPHERAERGYKDVLTRLDKFLKRKLGGRYQHKGTSKVALTFTYTLSSGATLDVDLLLSPFWDSQEHFLEFLRSIHPAKRLKKFSVSASKWQTEFIKEKKPQRVKELITRAKAWRNRQWPKDERQDGRPKSYLISMLVIVAYDRVPDAMKDEDEGEKINFKALARSTGEEFCKLVREITTDPDLSLTIPEAKKFDDFQDLFPQKPRIIDPGNPSNNLYLSGVGRVTDGNGKKWDSFVGKLPTFDITETPIVIMGYQ